MSHGKHIKRLKTHKNVLYGIIMLLLILQVISFITISSQITRIDTQQEVIKDDLGDVVDELKEEIELSAEQSQFSINEITKSILQQKKDFQGEIALLKATQEDFSGIIDEVIEGVVNIRTETSAGTGFVIHSGGYVVTNHHVIQDRNFIQVQTFDGTVYQAEIIGSDSLADLALLQIPVSLHELELKATDDVQVGEKVIAIGNPLGLSFTVTEGIVSAVDRRGPNGLEAYVQTDVTLNPGNSGGPLLDKEGKVIGINNFKIGGAESLGFALESDLIKERINMIVNTTLIE